MTRPTDLRTAIARKIVGEIYNQPDSAVGPATLTNRQRGLRIADEILAMTAGAPAATAADPDRRCDSNLVGGAGECIACDADQGEACRKPESRKNSRSDLPELFKRFETLTKNRHD